MNILWDWIVILTIECVLMLFYEHENTYLKCELKSETWDVFFLASHNVTEHQVSSSPPAGAVSPLSVVPTPASEPMGSRRGPDGGAIDRVPTVGGAGQDEAPLALLSRVDGLGGFVLVLWTHRPPAEESNTQAALCLMGTFQIAARC